jgi:hypothetical protein
MTASLLAAALIVKDEAQTLPGCLEALAELADAIDQVVVYDTGSVDGTQDLARRRGARVHDGYWDGDFARARNAAIELADARWVLIVDADERVKADVDRLRTVLEAGLRSPTAVDALVVPLVNQAPDGSELYAAPQIRVFRPDRAHYVGRLHERVEPRRPGARRLRLSEQARDVVHVRHIGYSDAQVVHAKALRNLELVDADLAAVLSSPDPDQEQLARVLYHRGRTLLSAGRVSPAVDDLQRLRRLSTSARERVWGSDFLAQTLLETGRPEEAEIVVAELRSAGVDARYCDWLTAQGLLAHQRFSEALELLRGVDTLVDSAGRVLDLAPVVHARMVAAGRVGEVDEAAACCIRLMAGYGHVTGLGPLLLTLWGSRPAPWLAELLAGADGGHLPAVAAELRGCRAPGPEVASLVCLSPVP